MLGARAIEGEVLPGGDWDPDTERLFSDFRDSFAQGENNGSVYVSRIPLDTNGSPMGNSKQQSRLFEAPLGTLTLDDICNRVKEQYMRPGEFKICVRIMGVQPGQSGPRFNRIVIIERPNERQQEKPSGLGGDIGGIIAAIQHSNDATAQRMEMLLARMMDSQTRNVPAPAPAVDPMAMMQGVIGMMAVAQKMFAMPAGIAPGMSADPLDQLTKLAGAVPRLARLFSGEQSPKGDMGSIIAAVAPAATEFFKALNSQKPQVPQPQRRLPQRRREPTPAEQVQAEVQQTVAEATAVTDDPTGAQPQMPPNMDAIKEIVSGLIEIAQGDPDRKRCQEAAAELLNEIPDEMDATILDLVSSPAGFKMKLGFVDPRTALYYEWFEELRKCVLAAFNTGDDAATS